MTRPSERIMRSLRRPFRFRSFRSQVALGFGGLAAVVAITLSVTFGSMFSEKSERDEATDLRQVAHSAAKALSDGLAQRSRSVEALAKSDTLWNDGLASDRVAQTLARTHALTPHSAWIGVTSPEGVVRSATDNKLVGVNVSERPWFQEGRTGIHVGDLHAAKLLARLLPPGFDGEPQRFVDFSSPIVVNGKLIGVLGMHGSWDWARSVVESLLPDDARARRLEVFVLNRDGQVIYASEGAAGMLNARMHLDRAADSASAAPSFMRDDDGRKFLVASTRVLAASVPLDLGWTVAAREPSEIALAAAQEGVKRSLFIGFLSALAACALGWFMAERLTRPLRDIAAAARAVKDGHAGAAIPTTTGSTEILQLSAALADMTAKLVDSNLKLESRVKERTAELEAANIELDRQARVDPLTGLLNRRGMEEQFRFALASSIRRRSPLSVLIVDIDHFKRVNDTHGHDTGDTVLQAVGAALQQRLRQSDVVSRLGGEEFVALLPDTDAAQARCVAQQLVEAVSHQHFDVVDQITISCGVAQVRAGIDTAETAMKRADEALYRAKGEGRNRASFADTTIELSAD
jgi:diguanylate cyclase (GGDEF)-like protein